MDKISGLKCSLSKYFKWNKARLDCFARIILSLFAVKTVNLKEIAIGFASSSQVDSRYRRLQRFFGQFKWDYCQLARWLFFWFFEPKQKVYLIVDRTNWYWGKQKINILMLSVAYEGLAIPLLWQMLNKGGAASGEEHCEIISRYVEWFGKENILGILGDREFGNGILFKYLAAEKIPFFIRIKNNICIKVGKKKLFTANKVFNHLNTKEATIFGAAVFILGQKVYLSGSRSERGELMIVATLNACKNAISVYLRRWEIENLFQGLKSRGFHFENTHITKQERLSSLLAVLAVAFCWAHKIGEWKALIKPIIFKQFRHRRQPQYTFFHYGLEFIRDILLNPERFLHRQFFHLLRLLPSFPPQKLMC
jgi:hypothetical protein